MAATPEQLTGFAAFMKSVMEAAERDGEVTAPDGTRLRVAKHPEPGVQLRIEPSSGSRGGLTMTLWEPAGERPRGYPADLPFVPGVRVQVTTRTAEGETLSHVQWQDVGDAGALMEQVIEGDRAKGWNPVPSPQKSLITNMQLVQLERGGRKRTLVAGGPADAASVIMIDTKQ